MAVGGDVDDADCAGGCGCGGAEHGGEEELGEEPVAEVVCLGVLVGCSTGERERGVLGIETHSRRGILRRRRP